MFSHEGIIINHLSVIWPTRFASTDSERSLVLDCVQENATAHGSASAHL
jgi:hypothetical protein